mmetsp:Transcript_27737/g.61687  ORF Transcript_27737/g.61687 Transcript_27737/m.61687 type:complete len:128 (+) Transcript_27737:2021-2404(+)
MVPRILRDNDDRIPASPRNAHYMGALSKERHKPTRTDLDACTSTCIVPRRKRTACCTSLDSLNDSISLRIVFHMHRMVRSGNFGRKCAHKRGSFRISFRKHDLRRRLRTLSGTCAHIPEQPRTLPGR